MFKAVKPQVNVPALEQEILAYWREREVFRRSMDERKEGPRYVFYEGPPTANGRPGSHHLIARAFKDLFPRYKTMQGHYVLRKGGWDTHGLPVEIEVQKELGIEFKHEIEEKVGIAAFNQKCKESVFKYIQEWEEFTERTGYWVSLEGAYVTYHNAYIQSVWWILKQLWDKGLIYQGYKVVPYCHVCGTPLSSHEVSLGYEEVDDPSAFVRFKLRDAENTYFLAWTTTPWTLPGNVALAVGKAIDYVLVEGRLSAEAPQERLCLAQALFESVVLPQVKEGGGYQVVESMKGAALVGMHYEPLYRPLPVEGDYAYVTEGDFVSTQDGTGIVHIAPAFGADDLEIGTRYGLPVLVTVDAAGKFIPEVELVAGKTFKEADKVILKDLRERGLLFMQKNYRHNYPHCWRSKNPLMYYARHTWYIRTTAYRDQLVALNNTINWVPEHTKQGRFGSWLEDVKDWALGRERFWGTPLPVWVCDNPEINHAVCVGSVAELESYVGRPLPDLELHRPYVDDITWEVEVDGKRGTMRRVPEVIDVWFDSGAMPFAQWGYPFQKQELFEDQYPADYICEAVDQTRGWFYSLHAISTMLSDSVAYKNVISLGHILGADGKKMSKSRPETFVAPWDVLNQYGADAFRWYMYVSAPPGESRVLSLEKVGDVVRGFYLTLWNVFSFFTTYAALDKFDPASAPVPLAERDALDRWILGELNLLVERVTQALEAYDVPNATRPVEEFVDDLSNWYLRRSRRRFWRSEDTQDKLAAYQTLYECLVSVAKLLAPSMPFLAERLYVNLVAEVDPSAPDSVHLARWPQADRTHIDAALVEEMRLAKRLVSLGHGARNAAKIRVRQPLSEAAFGVPSTHDAELVMRLQELIADELNVKRVRVLEADEGMVSYALKPVDTLGRDLRGDFPAVRQAIVSGTPEQVTNWARALLAGENMTLEMGEKTFSLSPQQVIVMQSGAEGYAVMEEGGYVAALNTQLDDALLQEGLAREVVRRIQTLRKDADLDLSDRIRVHYAASTKLAEAIAQYQSYIAGETLSEEIIPSLPGNGNAPETFEFEEETLRLFIEKLG
ncbi:MAG: isoleucine--tRNA ligase [Anaerolineae bacterium]|nr:isoleucine--tRNA ligase [Anaerolineae bacterium]